jgi:hypothetical protein
MKNLAVMSRQLRPGLYKFNMVKIVKKDSKSNTELIVTQDVQETFKGVTNVTDKNVTCNTSYRFKSRRKNPEWSIEKLVPLRACLIRNNATPDVYISEIPKWLTVLEKEMIFEDTGEIVYDDYETDDFKAAKGRKIKTVRKFCDFYEPLYRARKVSLLFHTFTRMDYAKKDMRRMIDKAKIRYESLERPIRGYLWALELAKNEGMESGHHIHYHLVVAIDRLELEEDENGEKKIPKELKFDDLWGQGTQVEFIKRSVRAYLSKYLYKSDGRLLRHRSYAISRNLF